MSVEQTPPDSVDASRDLDEPGESVGAGSGGEAAEGGGVAVLAPPADDVLTRTQLASRRVSGGGVRRWWRRRPVRRSFVVTHRWLSLVLGLFLLLETTSGAILLYDGELFRGTHGSLYRHTESATPISAQQAIDVVAEAHPDFAVGWVSDDNGAWIVGDVDYAHVYGVDPGTGEINGYATLQSGVMGFLANVHECGLNCAGYPGYVAFMGKNIPTLGVSWLNDITWGGLAVGITGLLLIVLVITGLVTWWPGMRKLRRGVTVRTKKGRFARDYDLHNVVGMVGLPFLLMWAVTGAAFEFPVVERAWVAITAGDTGVDEDALYSFESNPAPENAPLIGTDTAISTALRAAPGRITDVSAPTEDLNYYWVDVLGGYDPYGKRIFYGGDTYVLIDAHDASHYKLVDNANTAVANSFYDRVFEPAHFGWMVNGWWRAIWFLFGITPLVLAVTATSTWLFRRGTRKRRRKAARERAGAPA